MIEPSPSSAIDEARDLLAKRAEVVASLGKELEQLDARRREIMDLLKALTPDAAPMQTPSAHAEKAPEGDSGKVRRTLVDAVRGKLERKPMTGPELAQSLGLSAPEEQAKLRTILFRMKKQGEIVAEGERGSMVYRIARKRR